MQVNVHVILYAQKKRALVTQHVLAIQTKCMLLKSIYKINDDELAEELRVIRGFVVSHYRYGEFSINFKSEISNASKNVVLYNKNKRIILFINFSINKTNNLVVHLLIGNTSQALTFALGILIYEVLNNGLDGIVYHVRNNNLEMLNLSIKGGASEVKSTREAYREFKCSISFLISKYKHYYHRFICNLPRYEYTELVYNQGCVFVNCEMQRMHSIHGFRKNGNQYYYLSDWNLSVHSTEDLIRHLYSNTSNGISEELQNCLKSQYAIRNNIKSNITSDYAPIDMFVFPTFACNLRCKYCYSEATPAKNINLTLNKGRKGIDFLFENAKKTDSQYISISFHGGGEPTVNINLINELAEYAERKSIATHIPVKFSISTNGTIVNDGVWAFVKKCESIQFSFDGTREIQNIHRPFADNKESFEIVSSNIRKIHEKFPELKIAIRSTISNLSVNNMVEFVKYFSALGANTIVFEPLIVTGRAKENKEFLQSPNMVKFSEQFIASREIGYYLGVNVNCSAASVFRSCHFCGATNSNFVLTPNGDISTCVEVSDYSDPLSEIFIIGKVTEDTISIDKRKLFEVRQRGIKQHPECYFCVAEKSCRGNCPTRAIRYSNDKDQFLINELCIMQTRLFLHNLSQLHSDLEKLNKRRCR